jgi:hypothetical protein
VGSHLWMDGGQKKRQTRLIFRCQAGRKLRLMASEVLRHIGPRIDRNADIVEGAAATRSGEPRSNGDFGTRRRALGLARANVVESSRPLLIFTSMEGDPRGLKRHQARNPQAGDSLGTQGPSPEGSFGKGRHLGCSGTHPSSRKGAGGGPARDEAKARLGGEHRVHDDRRVGSKASNRPLRPARSRAHDTRCPSRSGWGEALGARKRGERCWGSTGESRRTDIQPLTREHSASPLRKEMANRPPYPRSARKRRVRNRGRVPSVQVVLVDRFDCRSRRAARGNVRSRAKSSRKRRGLVLPHRSEGRKSVGSRPRVAKPGDRWRVRVRGEP